MARGFKTGGRAPGTPNKDTSERVAAIDGCFEAIGGAEAFARWAKRNRTEFYARVWARLLPRELKVEGAVDVGEDIVERLRAARERSKLPAEGGDGCV